MPVSKKRKKKQRSSPPPPKSSRAAAPKKRKITKQQIIIYVISGLMILSLAIGFLASGSGGTQVPPTPVPQEGNILLATPAPDDSQSSQTESDPATGSDSESTAEE